MAHPAATGRPARQDAMYQPQPASPGGSHHLLAADLKTGRHIWEQQISGDVITAPVISDGVVYFTTFDGTSYSLNATDGSVIWIKANAATSAPVVAGGYLYETRKEQDGKERRVRAWRRRCAFCCPGKGHGRFCGIQRRASAQLKGANENVGVESVVGGWAYRGSRAALRKGQILTA
jgi:hypothetical protein